MKRILAFTLLLFGAVCLNAQTQTITLTMGQHDCGVFQPGSVNCYNIPITDNASGAQGNVWLDYSEIPSGWIMFLNHFDNLSGAIPHQDDYVSSVSLISQITGSSVACGRTYPTTAGTETVNFSGVDGAGAAFSGLMTYTYTTHYGCSSGRGGGPRQVGTVTGGTITINYAQ